MIRTCTRQDEDDSSKCSEILSSFVDCSIVDYWVAGSFMEKTNVMARFLYHFLLTSFARNKKNTCVTCYKSLYSIRDVCHSRAICTW